MLKHVIVPGLTGAIALIFIVIIVDGIFGFNSRMNMNFVPNEQVVYEVLKANVVEPGRYVCNPRLTAEGRFPENEPVFSIQYAGIGHEAAGMQTMIGLLSLLLAPIIGAWMLSVASDRFRSTYVRRVLFFTVIGLFLAVFVDLQAYGISGYPLTDVLILGMRSIVTWTLLGLIVAWRMRPDVRVV
jgi:hypothetical protein